MRVTGQEDAAIRHVAAGVKGNVSISGKRPKPRRVSLPISPIEESLHISRRGRVPGKSRRLSPVACDSGSPRIRQQLLPELGRRHRRFPAHIPWVSADVRGGKLGLVPPEPKPLVATKRGRICYQEELGSFAQ